MGRGGRWQDTQKREVSSPGASSAYLELRISSLNKISNFGPPQKGGEGGYPDYGRSLPLNKHMGWYEGSYGFSGKALRVSLAAMTEQNC